MTKRERSEEPDCSCSCSSTAKRPAPDDQQKQHLYLLLDDWERGYSVRKLDVDVDADFDSDTDDLPSPTRFTEPPVARIESEHESGFDWVVSHGTKIFAMQQGRQACCSLGVPAFDTRTLATTVCPWFSPDYSSDNYGQPLLVSAAGKLFAFTDVEAFCLADQPPPHGICSRSSRPWSWTAVEPRPPFCASRVTCYALHPDGRTLFVSAASRHRRSQRSGTFSANLDAAATERRLEWTRRGDWLLPFAGQAYFDAELEAWVGLCAENAGRLCSCDVVDGGAGGGELASPPSWKVGADVLFRQDYAEQLRLGAKLVYMGGHSRFCLVEFLFHKDDEQQLGGDEDDCWPPRIRPRRRRVLSLTTFGVKYDKEGQLRTSMMQRGRACKMYERTCDLGGSSKPKAFWL